jgi:hypothetical protein
VPYTLSDHWKKLQQLQADYEKNHGKDPADNENDLAAFNAAKNATSEMIRLGLEMDNLKFLDSAKKIELGRKMDGLHTKYFGADKIPQILGSKSFSYAKEVFLQQLICSTNLEYDFVTRNLSWTVGVNLVDKTQAAKNSVAKLETSLKAYSDKNSMDVPTSSMSLTKLEMSRACP